MACPDLQPVWPTDLPGGHAAGCCSSTLTTTHHQLHRLCPSEPPTLFSALPCLLFERRRQTSVMTTRLPSTPPLPPTPSSGPLVYRFPAFHAHLSWPWLVATASDRVRSNLWFLFCLRPPAMSYDFPMTEAELTNFTTAFYAEIGDGKVTTVCIAPLSLTAHTHTSQIIVTAIPVLVPVLVLRRHRAWCPGWQPIQPRPGLGGAGRGEALQRRETVPSSRMKRRNGGTVRWLWFRLAGLPACGGGRRTCSSSSSASTS